MNRPNVEAFYTIVEQTKLSGVVGGVQDLVKYIHQLESQVEELSNQIRKDTFSMDKKDLLENMIEFEISLKYDSYRIFQEIINLINTYGHYNSQSNVIAIVKRSTEESSRFSSILDELNQNNFIVKMSQICRDYDFRISVKYPIKDIDCSDYTVLNRSILNFVGREDAEFTRIDFRKSIYKDEINKVLS